VTLRPLALAALALMVAVSACGSEATPRTRPTGADEIVIQVGEYRNDNERRTVNGPTITVYGDGRVIAGGGVSYRTGVFTAQQVDELLDDADRLGLFDPPYERVNPNPVDVPSVDSTVVRFAINGGEVRQRVVGRIDFTDGEPLEQFIYGLAEAARPVAVDIWTPDLYVRIDLAEDGTCAVLYDDLATQERRNYAWAILPGTDGVPPGTVPVSC
jgi:hypothetical protein